VPVEETPPPPPLTAEHAHPAPGPFEARTSPWGQEVKPNVRGAVPLDASPPPAVAPEIVLGKLCVEANVTGPVKFPVPWTSRENSGVLVPMPTFTLAPALFTPLILPSTKALLSATTALEPIAVAFFRVPVENAAPAPTAVLLFAVRKDLSSVCAEK